MATALIGGLVSSGHHPQNIIVVDPNTDQLARLASSFDVKTTHDGVASAGADVIVWAVKPHALREAANFLQEAKFHALHISIAAGVRLRDLEAWFDTDRVVRAMPNTSALVGAGVTGLLGGLGLSAADIQLCEAIVGSTGQFLWVASDEEMDAVTAVSGSGPAYVFHFLEGFQRAAKQLGFSEDEARRLVSLVTQGATKQAMNSPDSFGTLRERVTSRGGTTEAALRKLDEHQTQQALVDAVRAAADRAVELAVELAAEPGSRYQGVLNRSTIMLPRID